jgi:hypothetical protein
VLAKVQKGRHNTAQIGRKGRKVAASKTTEVPKIRELFIEDLAKVQGGATSSEPGMTTMACCEEGPFGCCEPIIDLDDLPPLRP